MATGHLLLKTLAHKLALLYVDNGPAGGNLKSLAPGSGNILCEGHDRKLYIEEFKMMLAIAFVQYV